MTFELGIGEPGISRFKGIKGPLGPFKGHFINRERGVEAMKKIKSVVKCNTLTRIHVDAVERVIDRMLSGAYNPRPLNPEDDLIDAIDKSVAFRNMIATRSPEDLQILMLRIVGGSIREISLKTGIPRSTIHDRLKRMTWTKAILDPRPGASDPALIGESTRGLHGIKRDREDERDHKAWISLGEGGYRKRAQGGQDGTQNG